MGPAPRPGRWPDVVSVPQPTGFLSHLPLRKPGEMPAQTQLHNHCGPISYTSGQEGWGHCSCHGGGNSASMLPSGNKDPAARCRLKSAWSRGAQRVGSKGKKSKAHRGHRDPQGSPMSSSEGRAEARSVADTCLYSIRHLLYEVIGKSLLGSGHHLVILAALQPVGNVVPHRAGEQHGLLGNHRHLQSGEGVEGRV